MHEHDIPDSTAWDHEDEQLLLRRTLTYLNSDDSYANKYIEMPIFGGILRHLFNSALDEVTEADETARPYSHMVKDTLSLASQLMTTATDSE